MQVNGKVVVVTGGSRGIGRALCRRFSQEGASGIVVADVDEQGASEVAREINGLAVHCDVSDERQIKNLVAEATAKYGPIDLFCSNAGITTPAGIDFPNEGWQRLWDVNFMAHLYAARAVIPEMVKRGSGYLLQTASAAGLLTEIGSAPYSVTKHAAVAFAEWLSIQYKDSGIGVSCICPLGVRTDMLSGDHPVVEFLKTNSVSPEEGAEAAIKGMAEEQLIILPHPEVAEFLKRKTSDHERWLNGMRRLNEKLMKKP